MIVPHELQEIYDRLKAVHSFLTNPGKPWPRIEECHDVGLAQVLMKDISSISTSVDAALTSEEKAWDKKLLS